jgi:AcrR family transcriptional regulator
MCQDVDVERLTRAESKARTRLRLLDAAEHLFLEQGYAQTSLEQIAHAAGITKPGIYRHFTSKEDLFLAVRKRKAHVVDVPALAPADAPYRDQLAAVGAEVARMAAKIDPRHISLQLEFRAASIRRPDARRQFGDEVRALVDAVIEADGGDPVVENGLSQAERILVGQLLVEALIEYRAYVPDLITENTFAVALALLDETSG